jgi:hypothetical protein
MRGGMTCRQLMQRCRSVIDGHEAEQGRRSCDIPRAAEAGIAGGKAMGMKLPRKSKYRAVRTKVDGVAFASKKEAARYVVLKAMQAAGQIRGLELQPKYWLMVGKTPVGSYIADFKYFDINGCMVVEDVKGFKTPVYRLKKKIVEAQYGFKVHEV